MKKIKNTIQQGDVLLRKLSTLPSGEKKVISRKKLILAEGEVTGHYHEIVESDSELIQIGDKIILSLANSSVLTHQEHNHVTVDAGIWEVGRVQEYDYFAQMSRQVAD